MRLRNVVFCTLVLCLAVSAQNPPTRTTAAPDWRAIHQSAIIIDGHAALEATDRSITSGFDGFSIVNAGGSWGIDSVVVQNARPPAAGS